MKGPVMNNFRDYKLVIIIILLLLSATAVRGDSQDIIKLLEEGLVSDNDNLLNLRKLYFNPSYKYSPVSVCLQVIVTAENIAGDTVDPFDCVPDGKAFNGFFDTMYELQLSNDDSGTSQLSDLLTTSGITGVFFAFDPTFYTIMKALSNSFTNIDNKYNLNTLPHAAINIDLRDHLEIMPCWHDVDEALRLILVWAKAYARTNGSQHYYQEVDRSSVSASSKFDSYVYDPQSCQEISGTSLTNPQYSSILALFIFILSNLLMLSSTVLYFRNLFLRLQQQTEQIKTLYKATAVVLTCVNVLVLLLDIYFIIEASVVSSSKNLEAQSGLVFLASGKAPLVLLILILETPVVCFNTHQLNQYNQMNKKRYRIAHAFASCQIIWFVHRLVTDMIISVVFFIIAPAQTLGVVTLLMFTLASAIAFVTIMIHKGCKEKKSLFCTALNGIIICGLLFVITLLYIVFVDNGLKSAGMGGLILSLVPPFSVFVIGLIVNQKLSRPTNSSTSGNTTTELLETQQNTAIQIDDEGELEEESHRPLLRSFGS